MTDTKDIARWMRNERQKRRWSAADLAHHARKVAQAEGRAIKLAQQTISSFEQGEAVREPGWLKYVAKAFSTTDGLVAEMYVERRGADREEDLAVYIEELPTYAGAGGGGTGEGDPATVAISRAIVEYELRASPSDLISVTIEGNSMSPDFLSGDRVLVDKRKVAIAQPGAFCLWDGDGYVVKYIERIPGAEPPKVRVISRNETFSTFERLIEEVRIMGRVVWLARRV